MTIVSNPSADREEKIEHAAKILRRSPQAKKVFVNVYGGHKKYKTIEEIRGSIPGFNTNTYTAAAKLAGEDIIEVQRPKGLVSYGKKDFYNINKKVILRLCENAPRLNKFPTKRKVIIAGRKTTYTFATKPRVKAITIDDIDSFSRVRNFPRPKQSLVSRMSERIINKGISKILGQKDKKDWGGERNDIFSTKVLIGNKRISTSFALKALKYKISNKSMGKNSDQIQRLFEGTSQLHVIGNTHGVHESLYDFLQAFALQKAIATGNEIYYCIIDGDDLSRIVQAYAEQF